MNFDGMPPPEAVERVVALRAQARLEKNWAESDRLRDALARCGVELKDGKDSTTWSVALGAARNDRFDA
jgi:cysteinyl-tRNA synthetase